MPLQLDSPLTALSGIGTARAALYQRLGIHTLFDLLRHYPRDYEDWTAPMKILDVPLGQPCCICATALEEPRERYIRKGMVLYSFAVSDGENRLTVTLFNNRYAAAAIRRGAVYRLYGTITGDFLRREMAAPQIEPATAPAQIHPLYPLTAGLSSRMIATTVRTGLRALASVLETDPLPETLCREKQLCSRHKALTCIHFPGSAEELSTARRRLVFEELFLLQLGLLQLKGRNRGAAGATLTADVSEDYQKLLPFSLTGAQQRAIAACLADMRGGNPMNRLLQGDVGSGKTAVAAGVAYAAIRNGYQAAMMAPTEILARQHYLSLSQLLAPSGITVALLKGGMSPAARREVLRGLSDGTIGLAVGTHALFTADVAFAKLGLVITDEQHRFGVAQRAALAAKGMNPHLLVMSATPIPRTLALMVYGDLDVSVLNELPPGRQPIATYAIGSDKRERAYGYVKKHLDAGRQAYIVCPLVEESEESAAASLASAEAYAASLAEGAFQGYRIGLLHGRMKGADKEQVMAAFAAGDIRLLVSTTVVEVGVDVPNAVIMLIENAERFGLAQLHQLRGRVGRGKWQSTCILISDAQNEEAQQRLRILCQTNDGFRIANEDLKLRGPGDFFGNRQHGLPELKIADLSADMALLAAAQDAAHALLEQDPTLSLPEHTALLAEVQRLFARGGEQSLN